MNKTLLVAAITLTTFGASGFAAKEKTNLTQGINFLGVKTLTQIQKGNPGKNVFLSGLSLSEALSMVYTGAEGTTRQELAKLLGIDANADMRSVNRTWKSLREELTGSDAKVKFDIANSMWGNRDQRVRFVKDFVNLNREGHDAEVRDEDFQSPDFLGMINGWVSDKTNGKIPTILSGSVRDDQLFFLVNAIYFKGTWAQSFDKKLTIDDKFKTLRGNEVDIKLMRQHGEFQYYSDKSVEAVKIPFGTEKRYHMAVYLPHQSVAEKFLNAPDPKTLARINESFRRQEGTVLIPRFKIEYGNEKMVDIFKAMGVRQSFTDSAQFPNIAQNEAAKINVIIHKAVIEVNEEGAEAAAATVVGGVRATSININRPFVFEANRPFYFEIADSVSGTTLFSGVLHEPTTK